MSIMKQKPEIPDALTEEMAFQDKAPYRSPEMLPHETEISDALESEGVYHAWIHRMVIMRFADFLQHHREFSQTGLPPAFFENFSTWVREHASEIEPPNLEHTNWEKAGKDYMYTPGIASAFMGPLHMTVGYGNQLLRVLKGLPAKERYIDPTLVDFENLFLSL